MKWLFSRQCYSVADCNIFWHLWQFYNSSILCSEVSLLCWRLSPGKRHENFIDLKDNKQFDSKTVLSREASVLIICFNIVKYFKRPLHPGLEEIFYTCDYSKWNIKMKIMKKKWLIISLIDSCVQCKTS